MATAHGVEFIPVSDALLRGPELRFVAALPILGIPTHFETNSPTVLGIVERAFGVWSTLAAEHHAEEQLHSSASPRLRVNTQATVSNAEPARIRIIVTPSDEVSDSERASVRHISTDDGRLIIQSAGSVAISDPRRRDAVAYVSTALVADAVHFRTELLEAMTLALLSGLDRHPVHAAAVVKDGRAALFAASSGTGKSTLAYLCHVAGHALMAEDRVYVQLEPATRVWGWPGGVRLLPDVAARLDRANADVTLSERRGRAKVELDASSGMNRERLVASDFVTCILTRDGGPAALEPLSPETLARALAEQLAAGFDRFPARWPTVVSALASRGGWRLNLSQDPMAALPFVHDILRGVHA